MFFIVICFYRSSSPAKERSRSGSNENNQRRRNSRRSGLYLFTSLAPSSTSSTPITTRREHRLLANYLLLSCLAFLTYKLGTLYPTISPLIQCLRESKHSFSGRHLLLQLANRRDVINAGCPLSSVQCSIYCTRHTMPR